MFDEIFKRWIDTNQLTNNDIIPLLLEWNQTFGDGKATGQSAALLLQFVHVDYNSLLNHILKMVGIKKGYEWSELYDQQGRLIKRFWNKQE